MRAENLHLTLYFLGAISPDRPALLLRSLSGGLAGTRQFACQIRAIELFPSARRARVVAASLADDTRVARLAAQVDSAVVAAGAALESAAGAAPESAKGVAADARHFRAHVTLGRVRKPPLAGVAAGQLGASLAAPPLPVRHVVLYRSELRAGGARYTELGRVALA